eukprot:TRINITY_DN17263_c0_g1_i1.p1 TRINITY_DN17263_c0_g1~~TRINITY_DN17263_c0_g1_i1.p1  ORF type:complete len:562 (-),score=67.95 TRINITY_DN17263_c0_g1_i1:33-1718(-)
MNLTQPAQSPETLVQCRWKDCNERFPVLDALGQHLTIYHIKAQKSEAGKRKHLKGFICEWEGCSDAKLFRDSCNLVCHLRYRHTDEKPYTCPEPGCNQAFVQAHTMKKHSRTFHMRSDEYQPQEQVPTQTGDLTPKREGEGMMEIAEQQPGLVKPEGIGTVTVSSLEDEPSEEGRSHFQTSFPLIYHPYERQFLIEFITHEASPEKLKQTLAGRGTTVIEVGHHGGSYVQTGITQENQLELLSVISTENRTANSSQGSSIGSYGSQNNHASHIDTLSPQMSVVGSVTATSITGTPAIPSTSGSTGLVTATDPQVDSSSPNQSPGRSRSLSPDCDPNSNGSPNLPEGGIVPQTTSCRWSVCTITFTTVEELGSHLTEHIRAQKLLNRKEKRSGYVCEWIGCQRGRRPFKGCYNLEHHLRYQHTGEKPFPCPKGECDSRFAQQSDLKEHLRNIHNDSKEEFQRFFVNRKRRLMTSSGEGEEELPNEERSEKLRKMFFPLPLMNYEQPISTDFFVYSRVNEGLLSLDQYGFASALPVMSNALDISSVELIPDQPTEIRSSSATS